MRIRFEPGEVGHGREDLHPGDYLLFEASQVTGTWGGEHTTGELGEDVVGYHLGRALFDISFVDDGITSEGRTTFNPEDPDTRAIDIEYPSGSGRWYGWRRVS